MASPLLRFQTAARPAAPSLVSHTPSSITVGWAAYAPVATLGATVTSPYAVTRYMVRLYRGSPQFPARPAGEPASYITTLTHTTDGASESDRQHTFASAELTPGDAYWADVKALVEGVWSGWSAVASVPTAADVPLTPSAPTVLTGYSRQAAPLHLPCISPASHPHLGCISAGDHRLLAAAVA